MRFPIAAISLSLTPVSAWCPVYADILTNVTCESATVCPPEVNQSSVINTVNGGVRSIQTTRCAPYREWTCAKNPRQQPACSSPTTYRLPAEPFRSKVAFPVGMGFPRGETRVSIPTNTTNPPFQGVIGVMITGVPIYSVAVRKSVVSRQEVDAENDAFLDVRAGASEIEDFCGGFTDVDGIYHVHRLPRRVVWAQRDGDRARCALPHDDQEPPGRHSELLGYMLDGFPIYGPRDANAQPTRDRLDECGGHEDSAPGEPSGYHYHFTDEYPFSIECFRGCPLTNSGSKQLDAFAARCVRDDEYYSKPRGSEL